MNSFLYAVKVNSALLIHIVKDMTSDGLKNKFSVLALEVRDFLERVITVVVSATNVI